MPADVSQLLQLAAAIKQATTPVKKAAADTVKATTKEVEAAAKRLAPVDSGALRDSIDSEVSGGGNLTRGVVSAGEYYAMFVEFGTAKMAPQPFMTPAVEGVEDDFYKDAEDAVLQAVQRALNG